MGILLWIIFGGLAGWVASLIMKTDERQGIVLNVVIGVIGAVLGGWLMSFLGGSGVISFNFYSFLVAIAGACVFIAGMRAFTEYRYRHEFI